MSRHAGTFRRARGKDDAIEAEELHRSDPASWRHSGNLYAGMTPDAAERWASDADAGNRERS